MPHLISTLASMVLVVLLGLFVLWKGGNWLMDELVFGNGYFAVRSIRVQNDGMIDSAHFRQWAGIHQGDNLLRLDLRRVKRDLESVPWVREAGVKRVLPDTVVIDIAERRPLATLNLPELLEGGQYRRQLCQIDATGFITRIPQGYVGQDHMERHYASLPHILPYAHSVLRDGRLAHGEQIHAALEFLRIFSRSPLQRETRIECLDLSEKNYLRVLTRDHSEIILSMNDFARQVARWNEVFRLGQQNNQMISYLDLSVNDFLPVRWEELIRKSRQSKAQTGPTSHPSDHV